MNKDVLAARRERLEALKAKIRKGDKVHESTVPAARGGRSYVLVIEDVHGWPLRVSAKDEGLAWARLFEQLERRNEKANKPKKRRTA